MAKRLFQGGGSGKKGFSGFPVSSFSQLQDTPHSYAGKALNIPQVNAGETGLEFIPGRSQANGVAALDASSKVPAAQIPSIAITEFLGVVANQAAMLLLTGEIGDWCIRSDLSTTWIITANDGHLITDWTQIVYPVSPYKVLVDGADGTPDYLAAKLYGSIVSGIRTEIVFGPSEQVQFFTIVSPFSWSNPIISFWDASGGQPPLVLGARYIISVAGFGLLKDFVYECLDGISWTGYPGVLNQSIWNNADKMLYVWDGLAWKSRLQIDAAAATGSLRTLGNGATNACAGNDARLSDARTPTAHAFGGALHTADTLANLKSKVSAPGALITNDAGEIAALTDKPTPVGADLMIIEDSADTNKKKRVSLSNFLFPRYIFFAENMNSPNNADFGINSLAPASPDSANNAIIIRQFDDTTIQAVSMNIRIPLNAKNFTVSFVGRAQTAPGGPVNIDTGLTGRSIRNNVAVPVWWQVTNGIFAIPTNTRYQFFSTSYLLSDLGILPDDVLQLEFYRTANGVNDTLVGNFNLWNIKITFT